MGMAARPICPRPPAGVRGPAGRPRVPVAHGASPGRLRPREHRRDLRGRRAVCAPGRHRPGVERVAGDRCAPGARSRRRLGAPGMTVKARALRVAGPCAIVIFGAAGDLTKRKLFPALYNLKANGLLPRELAIIGVTRKPKTHEAVPRRAVEGDPRVRHPPGGRAALGRAAGRPLLPVRRVHRRRDLLPSSASS